MAAGGMVNLICVMVIEFLFDDLLVVFLLFFLLTVTRAGAIRHGGWLMGGISVLLAGG